MTQEASSGKGLVCGHKAEKQIVTRKGKAGTDYLDNFILVTQAALHEGPAPGPKHPSSLTS